MSKHSQIDILTEGGNITRAQAPVIISASRATDIPAFFSNEFFKSLERGYTVWKNPYNGHASYVSYAQTRFIVFWSKNPTPLLSFLPKLVDSGIGFYIQFTLNDYEPEGLEPNVPKLTERIDCFKRTVDLYGVGHSIWRFDPLILTDRIKVEDLLERISKIGRCLKGYTEKLVISFADIGTYKRVGQNMASAGVSYREWTEKEMRIFAEGLKKLNSGEFGYDLGTCAESIDLKSCGIEHNRCIDPDLISRLSPDDMALQMWLLGAGKDSGQRKACGCILSKDIGSYNTCAHGCLYCYANRTPQAAYRNYISIKQAEFNSANWSSWKE